VESVKSVVKNPAMKHEELTHEIIGAAMAVLNELKPGLDEKLYENALIIELQERAHRVDQQRQYPVFYRGHLIGKLVPDVIVDDRVVVDPKVVTAIQRNPCRANARLLEYHGPRSGAAPELQRSEVAVEKSRAGRDGIEPRMTRMARIRSEEIRGIRGIRG